MSSNGSETSVNGITKPAHKERIPETNVAVVSPSLHTVMTRPVKHQSTEQQRTHQEYVSQIHVVVCLFIATYSHGTTRETLINGITITRIKTTFLRLTLLFVCSPLPMGKHEI